MNKNVVSALATLVAAAGAACAGPKNVILFIGDGAGVSSLNASSICTYGRPQALYMQRMPQIRRLGGVAPY